MSLPVALDTNLLVRLLTNDDPQQAERVADLIDASAGCFVPITVVLELEWVLRGAYKLPRDAVIRAFEGLMAIRQVHLEQEELARSEGCGALLSFDRSLVRLAADLSLKPDVLEP